MSCWSCDTRIYGAVGTQLLGDHRGITSCHRYKLSFDETVRRHTSKPQVSKYGPDRLQHRFGR